MKTNIGKERHKGVLRHSRAASIFFAVLTFAIPFYSNVEYLRAAIESVRRQTITDWKMIVSDNCSPEKGIPELIESLKDPRIRYSRNDRNLGLAGNLNRCLELAETELVTLLHSDDELLPDYAEVMLAAARSRPEATAYFCRARIIDEAGAEIFSFPDFVKRFLMLSARNEFELSGDAGAAALLKGNFIICPSICYRKSRLRDRRFDAKYPYALDLDLYMRILLGGGTLLGVPQVAYAYRRHGQSTSAGGMADTGFFQDEVDLYQKIAEVAAAHGWDRTAQVARRMTIIRLQVGFYALKSLLRRDFQGTSRNLSFLFSIP